MAKLQLTLPEGVHASNGKHITFKVPDNCLNITGVIIEDVTYDLYDTYGNNVDFQSFMEDGMVSITIDTDNNRAILLSSAPQVLVVNISGDENSGYQCDASLSDMMKANSINQVVIAKYGDAIYTFGNCSDSVAEFYRCDISSSDDFNYCDISIITINGSDISINKLQTATKEYVDTAKENVEKYVDDSLADFSTKPYIISDTAPENTNLFWIDSANANFMKAYDDANSQWIPISAAFG